MGKRNAGRATLPEWIPMTAIGVGCALIIGVVAIWGDEELFSFHLRATTSPASVVTSAPAVTVTADPLPAATVTVNPTDSVEVAQRIKPLRDLVAGDRVLYVSEPGGSGAVCTWNFWGGEIGVSNITCGSDTFDTPTGYLTPVEARPDE